MEDVFQVVLYIAASIALLALAWLFFSLVKTVNGLQAVVQDVPKIINGVLDEVKGLRGSLQGTIENLEGITGRVPQTLDRVNESVERVNSQLVQVEGIVGSMNQLTAGIVDDVNRISDDATDVVHAAKGVVISLIELQQDIQRKVQAPIVETMSIFSALGRGIHVFRKKLAGEAVNGRVVDTEPGLTPTVTYQRVMSSADGM